MSNTIQQFDYSVSKMSAHDTRPFNPHVQIELRSWTSNPGDTPCISPHLMTATEIDWHINALKEDLDAVGKKAKVALLKAKETTRALVFNKESDEKAL